MASSEWVRPHDVTAEKAVLGSMLASGVSCSRAMSLLVPADFYEPRHQLIFETLTALFHETGTADPIAVHHRLLTAGKLRASGGQGYLADLLVGSLPAEANVTYYAGMVADLAQRRALVDSGLRIAQRAGETGTLTADELTAWATEEIEGVAGGTGDSNPDDGLHLADMLAEPEPRAWVIPGLLERGDRLMITGGEGGGKTTLIRQLAVATACGLHPFTLRPVVAARVMVVDCENGRRLTQRRYGPLLIAGEKESRGVEDRWCLYLQPGGIDLTQRAGSAWFLRRVQKCKPDLIVIGPLYRLHVGDPNDERDARRIATALDRARELAGAAMVLEAHAPHADPKAKRRNLRPVGSSLWLRWPEFGIGLQPADDPSALSHMRVTDLTHWRGARDERDWPKRLRAGTPWPWVQDQEGWRG